MKRTYVIGKCVFPGLEFPEMLDQVQRGMALLDHDRPGWEESVYLPDLDISSGSTCILGQVYRGDYLNGFTGVVARLFDILWWRGLSDADYQMVVDHGFCVGLGLSAEGESPKLQLEMVWSVFIQQRMEVLSHA